MSDWISKAKDFLKGHPEQAESGLRKVEQLVNDKTGGRYAAQLDRAGDAVRGRMGLPPEGGQDSTTPAPQPEPVPGSTPPPGPAQPSDPGTAPVDPGSMPGSIPREPVPTPGPAIPEIPEPDLPGSPGPEQPDLPRPGQPVEPSDRGSAGRA